MQNIMRTSGLTAAAIAVVLASASPAMARPWHHHFGRFGAGAAAGFATGALIGGALASPYYYGGGPYDGGPYYAYEPGYAGGGGGGSDEYCMQRFRSYDPASGTYLGYDGVRHPCP